MNPEFYEFHYHGGHSRKKRLEDVTLIATLEPWQVAIDGEDIILYMTDTEMGELCSRCKKYEIPWHIEREHNGLTLTFKEREEQ